MELREIIGQDGLMNAKVAAGLNGIHRQIDSISVLEVAESTISTWVVRNQPEAEGMAEQILKPLYEFDQKKGTELTHTLKVLLQCQMEQGAAAKRLFVHRNTILYRKNQITEILGYPAFEMPYIVNLMAAVVLKER